MVWAPRLMQQLTRLSGSVSVLCARVRVCVRACVRACVRCPLSLSLQGKSLADKRLTGLMQSS